MPILRSGCGRVIRCGQSGKWRIELLFRRFVGLRVNALLWDHSTFSKYCDRLTESDVAARFLAAVLAQPCVKHLLSSGHFSADGTLIEACASDEKLPMRARAAATR